MPAQLELETNGDSVGRRVVHFDRLEVRFDKTTMTPQADGSRFVDGFGAHVGTYTYHDDAGRPFVEHVPASTLFEPASLESAAGSVLTIRHGPGLVTPDRYREEAHGAWVKAWDAGDKLGVRLRLGSREALDFVDAAIAKGEPVELSPVYEVDVVPGQDAAEAAKYGRADATQRDRRYSGIALLGPNEARGGPEMALKLDSKIRAPDGCRVQVGGLRLDSAAPAPLHSATGRPNDMKQATIKFKGRSRKVGLDALGHLGKIPHGDQVETGRVTIEIEGQEPSELVLPVSMIDMLLEGIGAAPAAPPPAEAPAEEAPAEEMAAVDAKLDAKIKKAVADALADHEVKRKKADARDAQVHADAATILPPAYDFSVPWPQICVDAIAKVAPDLEARARKLAADAQKDPEAAGMLRQMLAERRQQPSSSTTKIVTKGDANDKPAWQSPVMPGREKQ